MARVRKYWTAAATKFTQEQRAAHNIEKQGFEYYLPQIAELSFSGVERRELLFPGYIFIKIRKGWESLMSTRGISRLFLCNDKPTRIPTFEIQRLKDMEGDDGLIDLGPSIVPGQKVVADATAGSFSYLSGVVKGMSARNRVEVLFSILGRDIAVTVDRRALTLV